MARVAEYTSTLPVICVGNFTAGGAGKTPASAMIVRRLIEMGLRPAILTRGYGGRERGPHWVRAATGDVSGDTAETVGDEPLLHAAIAPTMVARDRVAGARCIEAADRFDVIIMDDGLQNPALGKSLSIAVVDGRRGVGNGRVIPAGPLRAPLSRQIGQVDAVLFNGAPDAGVKALFERQLGESRILYGKLVPKPGLALAPGEKVVAFAGIGHPERFFDTVRNLGCQITEAVAFPDHHAFSSEDARRLVSLAARHGAPLVTTEKDHVRMVGNSALEGLAAGVVPIGVEMQLEEVSAASLIELVRAAVARRSCQ